MLHLAKQKIKLALNRYVRWVCLDEFKNQSFSRFNERPVEYAFVFQKISELYPRTILDVGTGTTALPQLMRMCGALVTAVDNVRDYWLSGMMNRHYHVIDDDITSSRLDQKFGLITCISVLEHIKDADRAIKGMFSLLEPGGHLILTFPYSEKKYVRNVYELPGSSYGQGAAYITQSFSRSELDRWLRENNGEIIEQEYWRFWEGDFWTVGRQLIPPKRVGCEELHQLSCLHIRRKRF